MLLILNADDLGAGRKINDTIFELMSNKQITSATLIANAPYFEEAVKKIHLFPYCSFGIHLNITSFQPLLKNNKIKTILDEEENFISEIDKISITPYLSKAIYYEFCAQIEKTFSFGVKISHIDSHQHIHTIPNLFPVLKLIQKKYNIKKVRISRNIYSINYNAPKFLLFKKKIYNILLRNIYKTVTTCGFTDLFTFLEKGKNNKLQCKSIEIMTHPGILESKNEISLLTSSWQKNLPFDVNLINFNQL